MHLTHKILNHFSFLNKMNIDWSDQPILAHTAGLSRQLMNNAKLMEETFCKHRVGGVYKHLSIDLCDIVIHDGLWHVCLYYVKILVGGG